jgi:type I restriction enzyme M protein
LGLIFLRFADNKYSHTEAAINNAFAKDKRSKIERPIQQVAIEKCGFYLPEKT